MFLDALDLYLQQKGFLCTCRDVSSLLRLTLFLKWFSLHMQRCFWLCDVSRLQARVFSAHAEMFLRFHMSLRHLACFLCTCRDVSHSDITLFATQVFSLHMQRCFYVRLVCFQPFAVFSAHAEMFPKGVR